MLNKITAVNIYSTHFTGRITLQDCDRDRKEGKRDEVRGKQVRARQFRLSSLAASQFTADAERGKMVGHS